MIMFSFEKLKLLLRLHKIRFRKFRRYHLIHSPINTQSNKPLIAFNTSLLFIHETNYKENLHPVYRLQNLIKTLKESRRRSNHPPR